MRSPWNILVTGASGFLGGYIVRDLIRESGHHIYALHREGENFGIIPHLKDRVTWVTGDILDVPFLDTLMSDMDVVIHAAALVSFHRKDHQLLYQVNYKGTRNLINVSLDHDIQHFVHISSIAALGKPPGINMIDENVDWVESKNNTVYAISKQLAELEVFRGKAEGLEISILCPSVILGTGFWDQGTSLFFKSVRNGLKFYPVGKNGWVDVRDVSKSVLRVVQIGPQNDRVIINGTNEYYQHIFEHIANAFKVPPPSIAMTKTRIFWLAPLAGILERILGRKFKFGPTVLRNTSHEYSYDHTRSKEKLGLDYRPIDQSIREIVDIWEMPPEERRMLE